jgi:TPR repeat protein
VLLQEHLQGVCSDKCEQYDDRCPLCRAPATKSDAEWMRRLQKHVDKGNAEAPDVLGTEYRDGGMGLQQDYKRAFKLFERAAAQEHAEAMNNLGTCYDRGQGVKIDHKAAAQWFQRAAEQGYPNAQANLGGMFYAGKGVEQSYDEAVRLAAAQGFPDALYNLGACHGNGRGTGPRRGAAPPQARRGQGARRCCGGGRQLPGGPRVGARRV